MKQFFIIILCSLFFIGARAQSPQSFKYQTTVRDNTGNLLSNKLVAFRISLLQGSASGNVTYAERHNIATNDFGIANFNVGQGSVLQGVFASINWGNGPYFLKIELDLNNGTNYVFMGSSQLLSVPFAMYAANSGNAADDKDKDSTNELQMLEQSGAQITLSKGNTVTIDPDTTNEIQQLSLAGNTLSLSNNGGQIDLTKYSTDSQSLSLTGNTLSISRGNSIILSGAVDIDSDPTNEIQALTINNDSIYLSKSNAIKLPSNFDNDSINEIQTLTQNSNTLNLSKNGGNVNVPSVNNIQNNSLLYATAIGVNQINLTLSTTLTSYQTGMIIYFKAQNNNTGHTTINLNGVGAKSLFKNVTDSLTAKDIRQNQIVSIIYDGNNFQLLTQAKFPVIGEGLVLQNDTLKQKFRITNYEMPGYADRAIYLPPDSNFTYTVPNDSIAIIKDVISRINLSWSSYNNDLIYVFNSGEVINRTNSPSHSSITLSKKYVTPIKLSFNQTVIVPIGKKLCITGFIRSTSQQGDQCFIIINNNQSQPIYGASLNSYLVLPSGSSVTVTSASMCTTNCCTGSFLTGYLFE
jgi:hypothetical protein